MKVYQENIKKHHTKTLSLKKLLNRISLLSFYFFLVKLNSPNGIIYLALLTITSFTIYLTLKKLKPTAEDIVKTSQEHINTFRAYQTLINKIEYEGFKSKKLCQLQSILTKSKFSAFNEINSLCRLLEFSQQRGINKIKIPIKGNPFYSLQFIYKKKY